MKEMEPTKDQLPMSRKSFLKVGGVAAASAVVLTACKPGAEGERRKDEFAEIEAGDMVTLQVNGSEKDVVINYYDDFFKAMNGRIQRAQARVESRGIGPIKPEVEPFKPGASTERMVGELLEKQITTWTVADEFATSGVGIHEMPGPATHIAPPDRRLNKGQNISGIRVITSLANTVPGEQPSENNANHNSWSPSSEPPQFGQGLLVGEMRTLADGNPVFNVYGYVPDARAMVPVNP